MTTGQAGELNKILYVLRDGGDPKRYGDYEDRGGTETAKEKLFLIPEHFVGSDFSGDIVSVSNHRAFMEEFGKVEGVHGLHGGWHTYAIAIRLDVAESNEEIKKVLNRLEDWAFVDDEVYSEVENEWQNKAMPEVVSDIIQAMDLKDLIPDCDKLLEDTERIEFIAWDGINELNLDWSLEIDSAWIDFKKIQPYVEDRLLLDHCKDLPLLIGRQWSCNETKNQFEQKCKK